MSQTLNVYFQQQTVGTLRFNERFSFQYNPAWLSNKEAFAISIALPLRQEEFIDPSSHHFFINLLPEGNLRTLVCRRLGISVDNDYELLKAIGGECAGALSIALEIPQEIKYIYKEIKDDHLQDIHTRTGALPFYLENNVRLSLAGAQDKLPVYLKNNKIFLPINNAPSSHILKFDSPNFKYLVNNEILLTHIAQKIGLPVVDSVLLPKKNIALITRYDRIIQNNKIRRLHQEDFCQALGLCYKNKYEKEGGPGICQCFETISQYSDNVLRDLEHLLNWVIFNVLTGNADAHAKNLSFVYKTDGSRCLAPFYDLVCTRAYEVIDNRLAMAIGGESNPGEIAKKNWLQLANQIQMTANFVLSRVEELAALIKDHIDEVMTQHESAHGPSPIRAIIKKIIQKQTRRTLHLLKNY